MRKWHFIPVLLFLLASCAEIATQAPLSITPVAFTDLLGWNEDRPSEAMQAFAHSCAVLMKKSPDAELGIAGKIRDWWPACAALTQIPPHDDAATRAFFEQYFKPYAVASDKGDEGLFTGYYEAELRGSMRRTKRYHIPLYVRPHDLITVDLGIFRPEWKGQHIAGKVSNAKLVPYDDRAAIARDTLKTRAHVLLWVDDPVDAFFLEIQGSGRVRMTNGHIVRIGYDQANGRAYVAIGRALADRGEIEKPVTMQKIRAWLSEHPDRAQEIMNLNPSYVFFRRLKDGDDGPIGAEGVALTPLRSLAVDPGFIPLGVPLWLDTSDGSGAPLQRLVIAQDTGGAIKGSVRGDLFWGAGQDAEAQAGLMQSKGHYFIFLPGNRADAGP